MDTEIFKQVIGMFGLSGVFLYGCWYFVKRMEEIEKARSAESLEREKTRAAETLDRESRLTMALQDSVHFNRTTLKNSLDRNTEAMNRQSESTKAMAAAVENLPCREHFRKEDIDRLIHAAAQRMESGQ